MSKFSAEIPKGDGWGIEDVVQEITEEIISGRQKSRLVPCIAVIDVKKVDIDPESGNRTAHVRIRRIESLTSLDRIRKAQTILLEQVAERRGEGTMLPFEEKDILNRAFGVDDNDDKVTVGQQLQDDNEKEIDAELDERGRMLRHIVAVHDHDPSILGTEDEEARDAALRWHDEQHALEPDDRTFPDHDPESTVWRRVDLADMLGDAEEPSESETDQGEVPEFDAADADPGSHEIKEVYDILFDEGADEPESDA